MFIRHLTAACVTLALLAPAAMAASPTNPPAVNQSVKTTMTKPGVKTAMHQKKKHATRISCKTGMKRNAMGKCVSMVTKKK